MNSVSFHHRYEGAEYFFLKFLIFLGANLLWSLSIVVSISSPVVDVWLGETLSE